jgi:uncharacterized membrane protein YbhN (UPF0104 family)
MNKRPSANVSFLTKKRVLLLLVLLLVLYIIVPRIGSFSDSFAVVRQADAGSLLAAAAATILTFIIAATMYWRLALRPLPFRQTLLVQTASAFTNRLLPGGFGTLTLYVQYLRMSGHSLSEAITVAGTNNLLGIVGHLIILAVVLLVTNDSYPAKLQIPTAFSGAFPWLILLGIIVILGANLLVFRTFRKHAYRITKEIYGYILQYFKRPAALFSALGLSLVLTATYVTIFFFCTVAVGIQLEIQHVFLVFTIGMIVGTATPTPGGLVGAEAGLTGGLIAYGVSPDMALAAALVYRFLTYWLPLLPGFIVFVRIRKLYSSY